MKNFLISAIADIVLILTSYFLFRNIISGPTRHKIYEKLFSSLSRFVIYVFVATLIITGVTSLILYKTRFVVYLNIVAPALVSVLVGFLISTVPTKGVEESNSH